MLLTAERKFWHCVESGETPRLFGIEPPRPRIEAVRVIDMSSLNSWADFAGVYCRTRSAFVEHEAAKSELKKLMPEDAKEAPRCKSEPDDGTIEVEVNGVTIRAGRGADANTIAAIVQALKANR